MRTSTVGQLAPRIRAARSRRAGAARSPGLIALPKRRQRRRRVVGQLVARRARTSAARSARRATIVARRSNRLPRDSSSIVAISCRSRSRNASGTRAMSRAASARSRAPVVARRRHHRLDQRSRRVQVLRRPGRREERRHAGANREVLEVAELLNLRQRIDVHLARQVEQRLGAHARDPDPSAARPHCSAISRSPAARSSAQRAAADVASRDASRSARSAGMPAPRLLRFEQAERVAHFGRLAGRTASPAARRPPIARWSSTRRARCRGDDGGCCRGSCARTRARRRHATTVHTRDQARG